MTRIVSNDFLGLLSAAILTLLAIGSEEATASESCSPVLSAVDIVKSDSTSREIAALSVFIQKEDFKKIQQEAGADVPGYFSGSYDSFDQRTKQYLSQYDSFMDKAFAGGYLQSAMNPEAIRAWRDCVLSNRGGNGINLFVDSNLPGAEFVSISYTYEAPPRYPQSVEASIEGENIHPESLVSVTQRVQRLVDDDQSGFEVRPEDPSKPAIIRITATPSQANLPQRSDSVVFYKDTSYRSFCEPLEEIYITFDEESSQAEYEANKLAARLGQDKACGNVIVLPQKDGGSRCQIYFLAENLNARKTAYTLSFQIAQIAERYPNHSVCRGISGLNSHSPIPGDFGTFKFRNQAGSLEERRVKTLRIAILDR